MYVLSGNHNERGNQMLKTDAPSSIPALLRIIAAWLLLIAALLLLMLLLIAALLLHSAPVVAREYGSLRVVAVEADLIAIAEAQALTLLERHPVAAALIAAK